MRSREGEEGPIDSDEMSRRGAFLAIALATGLFAVFATAADASNARSAANGTAQSLLVSLAIPVAAFMVVMLLYGFLSTFTRPNRVGASVEASQASVWMKILALSIALAPLAALIIGILMSVHHAPARRGLTPTLARNTPAFRKVHVVPINRAVFGSSATVLFGLALLVIARGRLHGGWRGRATYAPELTGVTLSYPSSSASPAGTGPEEPPDPRDEPDPRRSVLLAYRRFSLLMSRSGLGRIAYETPYEFARRVVGAGLDARHGERDATAELTSLFAAARYSEEPLSPTDRTNALACLDSISLRIQDGQ